MDIKSVWEGRCKDTRVSVQSRFRVGKRVSPCKKHVMGNLTKVTSHRPKW